MVGEKVVTRALVDRLECGLALNHRALRCGSIAHGYTHRGGPRPAARAVGRGASRRRRTNQTPAVCSWSREHKPFFTGFFL